MVINFVIPVREVERGKCVCMCVCVCYAHTCTHTAQIHIVFGMNNRATTSGSSLLCVIVHNNYALVLCCRVVCSCISG